SITGTVRTAGHPARLQSRTEGAPGAASMQKEIFLQDIRTCIFRPCRNLPGGLSGSAGRGSAEDVQGMRRKRGTKMSGAYEAELKEKLAKIRPADRAAMDAAKAHWLTVGKPLNSLGKLEDAVTRMAGIYETADYEIRKKGLVIMCADNGVVAEGVS